MSGVDSVNTRGVGVREKLGEILVRKGRLDRDQLMQAIAEARANGVRLGAYLVDSRTLFEEDISIALADQFGLRYVVIDTRQLDPELAAVIPEHTARRLTVLPLARSEDRVRLAIADPTDVVLLDELRMSLEVSFDLVVGEPSAIRAGIDKIYQSNAVGALVADDEDDEDADAASASIDAGGDTESAPAVEEVNRLLRRAIELGASDLHFVPRKSDLHVRARVHGVMRDISVVPRSLRSAVIARLKVMGQLDIAERRLPQDGRVSISIGGVDMDLRLAILPSAVGEEAVIRIAYIGQQGLKTLEDIGFDPPTRTTIRRSLRKPAGAIIVAGPTGSGKTTTLYSALAELNDGSRTVVSIEDPVESLIDGVVQIEVNTRSGLTFARGLRTILRADPDVIMIGEIRDLETAEIALHAAMTGHFVLTTVHAQSAAAAIVRLRELGLADVSIASSVHTVLSQRLLRRPCTRCLQGTPLEDEEAVRIGLSSAKGLFRPAGCHQCDHTGYTGRVGIYEVISVDDRVRELLSHDAPTIEAAAVAGGTITLYEQARRLCQTGGTTVDEVVRVLGEHD
jgi:type II secretory ATPase GspE/PulE/Tfp pilus assembly ATPase PilB-like protein